MAHFRERHSARNTNTTQVEGILRARNTKAVLIDGLIRASITVISSIIRNISSWARSTRGGTIIGEGVGRTRRTGVEVQVVTSSTEDTDCSTFLRVRTSRARNASKSSRSRVSVSRTVEALIEGNIKELTSATENFFVDFRRRKNNAFSGTITADSARWAMKTSTSVDI